MGLRKNRLWLLAVFVAAAFACVPRLGAQPTDMGGYDAMRIDSVGILEGGFDGTIKRMAEGVRITLLSGDPSLQNLPIEAGRMDFTWPAGADTPSVIVMEGNVKIDHPQASVTAQRAEWNFERGELVFTGNPVMRSEQVKEMRGERMVLNFEQNSFQVTGARVSEMPLRGAGAGATGAAPVLSEGDVTDWPGLIGAMKADAGAGADTPGGRILATLPGSEREQFNQAPVELLVQNTGLVLRAINHALRQDDLYTAAAWEGKSLPEEARTLLGTEGRSAADTARLNRMLFESAFGAYVRTR